MSLRWGQCFVQGNTPKLYNSHFHIYTPTFKSSFQGQLTNTENKFISNFQKRHLQVDYLQLRKNELDFWYSIYKKNTKKFARVAAVHYSVPRLFHSNRWGWGQSDNFQLSALVTPECQHPSVFSFSSSSHSHQPAAHLKKFILSVWSYLEQPRPDGTCLN